jgi:hypothetical protein|tara:strand:+ start:1456 stop:1662 length:207 start_codon:yes stop_codon:yes gene_type:complete
MAISRSNISKQLTPKLGSGKRFKKLTKKLKKKGAKNPKALAAYIGRKKYGKKKFQKLAAKGRRRKSNG